MGMNDGDRRQMMFIIRTSSLYEWRVPRHDILSSNPPRHHDYSDRIRRLFYESNLFFHPLSFWFRLPILINPAYVLSSDFLPRLIYDHDDHHHRLIFIFVAPSKSPPPTHVGVFSPSRSNAFSYSHNVALLTTTVSGLPYHYFHWFRERDGHPSSVSIHPTWIVGTILTPWNTSLLTDVACYRVTHFPILFCLFNVLTLDCMDSPFSLRVPSSRLHVVHKIVSLDFFPRYFRNKKGGQTNDRFHQRKTKLNEIILGLLFQRRKMCWKPYLDHMKDREETRVVLFLVTLQSNHG